MSLNILRVEVIFLSEFMINGITDTRLLFI